MKPQPTRWFPTSRAQQLNGLGVSGWDMESPRGEKNEYFAVKAYQSNPWFYADTSVRTERLALTNVLDLLTLARGVIYGNGRPELTPCQSDDGKGVNRSYDKDDDKIISIQH